MVVVTFYDRENGQFYQAFGKCLSDMAAMIWMRDNIQNGQVQEFLALRNAEESSANDILYGCPCPELLEEMHNEGFYHCNFENFDYEIRSFHV